MHRIFQLSLRVEKGEVLQEMIQDMLTKCLTKISLNVDHKEQNLCDIELSD
jgi:hypothetical protein